MAQQQNNPTLKGRLLNLQKIALQIRNTLSQNQNKIKQLASQSQEGTQSTILSDKINFIRDMLLQHLQQIDIKIKKHINDQKQKNNQLIQMIAQVKNQKNCLQKYLGTLQERINRIQNKIGTEII